MGYFLIDLRPMSAKAIIERDRAIT